MPEKSALAQLKLRDRRFVEEYLIDFNGNQAAIRAGIPKKGARVTASRLLARANIQAAIAEQSKKLSQKLELTAERVLMELARISFSDKRKLFGKRGQLLKPHEWDDDTAAAVAAVDFENNKIRMHSKTEALNLAGRYLKLFKEDAPVQPQAGMYVLLAPATAAPLTPDEWKKLVQQHAGSGA